MVERELFERQVIGELEPAADESRMVKRRARGTGLPVTVQRGDKTMEVAAKFPPQK